MAKTIQPVDDDLEDDEQDSKSDAPPAQSPKPKSAGSSMYSSAGQALNQAGQSGLGAEGADPSMIGMQDMAMIQRGIQMMNLAFPENPGLSAVLADLTGRLQSIIPQLVQGSAPGGMGMFPPMGAPQAGMSPMAPPPTMGPPGAPPPMGAMPPGGPAGPPPQGMPPQGMPLPPR